jgi:peptidoglycan biosynthesis protein MviN/MurJ (putative lipid II flippase)
VLGYCQRLLVAIGTIIVAGPSLILQPRLAAASASGDEISFVRDLERAMRLTVIICTPIALWVSWLAAPIVRVAFERGAFDRTVTLKVAHLLPFMLTGMVPMLCTIILFRAFYARSDLRTAATLGFLGPVLYFIFSGVLISRGIAGIGIAYVLTWSVLFLVGAHRVLSPNSLNANARSFLRELVLLLATALLSAVMSMRFLSDWQSDDAAILFSKLVAAGVFSTAVCAFVALKIARVHDLQLLAEAVTPKFLRSVERH